MNVKARPPADSDKYTDFHSSGGAFPIIKICYYTVQCDLSPP